MIVWYNVEFIQEIPRNGWMEVFVARTRNVLYLYFFVCGRQSFGCRGWSGGSWSKIRRGDKEMYNSSSVHTTCLSLFSLSASLCLHPLFKVHQWGDKPYGSLIFASVFAFHFLPSSFYLSFHFFRWTGFCTPCVSMTTSWKISRPVSRLRWRRASQQRVTLQQRWRCCPHMSAPPLMEQVTHTNGFLTFLGCFSRNT